MLKGLSHVSLVVPGLEQAGDQLSQRYGLPMGPILVNARNVHGGPLAFIHPRDFLGALVELEEKAGSAPLDRVDPLSNRHAG